MDAKLPLQQNTHPKKTFELFQFLYKYGTILTIFILIAIFAAANPSFINGDNLINILRSISIVTIIAIGITISLTVADAPRRDAIRRMVGSVTPAIGASSARPVSVIPPMLKGGGSKPTPSFLAVAILPTS